MIAFLPSPLAAIKKIAKTNDINRVHFILRTKFCILSEIQRAIF